MQTPRSGLFATSHADKLWAIGGKDRNHNRSKEVSSFSVYDPEFNLWSDSNVPIELLKYAVKGCTFTSKFVF